MAGWAFIDKQAGLKVRFNWSPRASTSYWQAAHISLGKQQVNISVLQGLEMERFIILCHKWLLEGDGDGDVQALW